MSEYSDIKSDGGMDPRHRLDEAMYRHTVAQRDAAWREIEYWRKETDYWRDLHGKALDMMAQSVQLRASPPIKMATHRESFEAGKTMAFNQAAYTIGIDTVDGVNSVTVFRMSPGRDTVMVASALLPEDDWK